MTPLPPDLAPNAAANPATLPPQSEGTKALAALGLGITACVGGLFCLGVPALIFAPLALFFANAAERDIAAGRAPAASARMLTPARYCAVAGVCIGITILLLAGFSLAIMFAQDARAPR